MKKNSKPNILLILMDSAQAQVFGAYGGNCRTPFADELASEGVRFNQSFTPAPICHPARSCVATGLLPHANGFIANRCGAGAYPFNTFPDIPTTADLLSEIGYRCGYAGQGHIDLKGFHDDYSLPFSAYNEYLGRHGLSEKFDSQTVRPGGGRLDMDIEHARDTRYTARALELLDEFAAQDQPWFIQFDFDGPHPICKVPDPFFESHTAADAIVPGNFHDTLADRPRIHTNNRISQGTHDWSEEEWQTCNAIYYDMVSFLDSLVGRVLKRLEEEGLAENTIVIFTSDHGGMCGSHGILMHGTPAMYTEVMRVPLIVRAPERCRPGTEVDSLTSHVDLLSTIVELAGGTLDTASHGRSWAGMLNGDLSDDWRDAVSGQYHGNGVLAYSARLLRTKDWSYLWHITGEEELYDLANDPLELENLAVKFQGEQLLQTARERLRDSMQETNDPLKQQGLWRMLQF